MKRTHRDDVWCWSRYDETRRIDFHAYLWVRAGGNVAVDPLPLADPDRVHLRELGGVATVVVTNSDHVRATAALAGHTGARVLGPAGERDCLPIAVDGWLEDGDEPWAGLRALTVAGSKTPGELALLLEGSTLIPGDLVRSDRGGELTVLPDDKLRDAAAARESVRKLLEHPLEAVLCTDGWPVFRGGRAALAAALGG